MVVPLKPGVHLARPGGPVIETGRLKLRMWQESDIAPNTAMLADPATARFIAVDGKPVTDELVGWRNAAVMSGHWALHGFGYFVVEEKSTGTFAGRVGPWFPPGWPGFEVGWASPANFAARATPSRRRAPPSTGCSRPLRSRRSSIASNPSTPRRKPLRGGWGRERIETVICGVRPRRSG